MCMFLTMSTPTVNITSPRARGTFARSYAYKRVAISALQLRQTLDSLLASPLPPVDWQFAIKLQKFQKSPSPSLVLGFT
jgi:hypothetical protein